MKQLLGALSIILLISSCGTDATEDADRFGTWRIDSKTHATWVGRQSAATSVITGMGYPAASDSTAPDTAYFYSNERIQAEMQEPSRDVYEGDFEFKISDPNFTGPQLTAMGWGTTTVANLGSAFEVEDIRGTTYRRGEGMTYKIQMNFNCGSDDLEEDLRLAFLKYQFDSVTTPPDTLLYYELDTDGMQETARYISGC